MINNKGQSLVTFIIVLPLILVIFGMLIELSLISYHKTKIISVTKSIIANSIEDAQKDDIIMLYDKNDIKVDDIDVDTTSGLEIKLVSSIESFIGNIIGNDSYQIEVNIKGYQKDNKIYYEKG